jgi:uncharacterized protein (TIGR04255 family)
MRLKFKNPPINELVVGVYFASEVATLRAEHIGVFWSSIRTEFPKIQQQPVLTAPNAAVLPGLIELSFSNEFFPMPRYWLEASDDAYLMQIQKDAFIYNWRKRGNEYPHFDAVKRAFDRNLARYTDFLNAEFKIATMPISVAELTYVNIIEPCDYWRGIDDTRNVLPSFELATGDPTGHGASNVGFNQVVVERYATDLTVRTIVRIVMKGDTPALIIELRCSGNQADSSKSAVDAWYDRAHDLVGECFLRMTSPEIQIKHWQPVQ